MEDTDKLVGFEITEDFEQFNQINDIFSRAFWDKTIMSKDTEAFFDSYRSNFTAKRVDGFNQKDFALRNASWLISDLISNRGSKEGMREGFQSAIQNDTGVARNKVIVDDLSKQSAEIKHVAKLFGADLVGITSSDTRWHYSHRVDAKKFEAVSNDLPAACNRV